MALGQLINGQWTTKWTERNENESCQIIRMVDSEFNAFVKSSIDFYPKYLRGAIKQIQNKPYQPINNGVYRSGFAASQSAYEQAVT